MPVERAAGGTSLIDVLDRVLDKGIVIDAWVRVSLVGIDLITVEARIVVASIDTYLKYSEAVGQVAPVSKPAIEGKGYEEVIAENAALRAQLKASVPARRTAGRRRARAGPRLSATGRAVHGRPARPRRGREPAIGDERAPRGARPAARRVRQPHRDRRLRAARAAVAGRGPRHPPVDLSGPPVGRTVARSSSAPTGCRRRGLASFSVSLEDWGNPLVTAFTQPQASLLPGAALGRRSQAPAVDAVRGRGVPRACRSASPSFADEAFGLLLLGGGAPLPPELHWFTTRLQPEAGSDPPPAGADRRRSQAGPRALAALQHHQRRHRPDSADRHRRPAAHRQRARADAVHRVGGGKRRPPRRRAHEQHAAVVGAVEQGDRGDRRGAARAAAGQPGRRIGPACSSCSARSPRIRGRAAASCRFCATSPTCGAPARRSKRTTARCASPRCRRAPKAIA